MGNLKRFLAMTLTMLMVVGCFAMSGSVAAFDDVVDYQEQINLMNQLRIIEGYNDDEFGPDDDVERWQMALLIAKIMTGKVDDAYVNFGETQNNTAFEDIEVEHFYGSISYGNENGIILGTSATTFEPTNGIMIQDVFTMVVRMLGYGSASMDANYPWSYVDKAIQLGLDKDLDESYNNEDVATRGQAAVILYNALFAKKADGTTYAASKFNLTMETIVLTGTSKANMFATGEKIDKKLADDNYVAFNVLNADGTLGSETFYLLKSIFNYGEDADENLYFGQSYKVITKDNYTTVLYWEPIEAVRVDQTDFDGVKDTDDNFVIEGKTYKAVKSYSVLNNNQGKKFHDNLEFVGYDMNNKKTVNDATSYVMNAKRDILDDKGKEVFFYMPSGTAANAVATESSWKDAYKKEAKLENGTVVWVTPSQADWDNVYKYPTKTSTGAVNSLGSDVKANKVVNELNAYSDTVLYDDNSDGIYDRAIYTYYKFGFIEYNDDKHLVIAGSKVFDNVAYDDKSITYVTADGEVLAAADVMKPLDTNLTKGNYVLYSYNKDTRYVTIKEFFTPNQGLVTTIDKPNNKIAFDQVYYNISAGNVAGTKFDLGNSKLPGAYKSDVLSRLGSRGIDELQGRNVHYIEKDGKVLAVYEAYKNDGKYFVLDSVVGINSTGYVNALVYNNSNVRSVVTIASVEGDWYGASNFTSYSSNAAWLETAKGELFKYTTDALGNYHAEWINSDTDFTYYYNRITSLNNVWLEFKNGVAFPVFNFLPVNGIREARFFDDANGVAKPFSQFKATNDTVIIVMGRDGVINGFKGVPANGSQINLYRGDDGSWLSSLFGNDPVKVYVKTKDDPAVAEFIYVMGGSFSNYTTTQSWNYQSNNTIIYVEDDTMATETITNQTNSGYGVTLGAVYSYNKAIDFVNGGVKDNILTYNGRLSVGNFYEIKDNYVEALVSKSDSRIGSGQLVYVDTYEAVVQAPVHGILTEVIATNYRANFLFEVSEDGKSITDTKPNKEDIAPKNMIKDVRAEINNEGSYAAVYYYAGDLEAPANVFIYNKILKDLNPSARKLYQRNDWVMEDIKILSWEQIDIGGYFGTLSASGTVPVLLPVLERYSFAGAHSNTGAFNIYEINANDYARLSSAGVLANDGYNYVIKDLGTNMRLFDPNGNEVTNFTNANVIAFTQLMYTNAGGYKYFLGFTSTPTGLAQRVGGVAGTYTLRYNVNNAIVPYEIELTSSSTVAGATAGFGLDPFRYVILNHNMFNLPRNAVLGENLLTDKILDDLLGIEYINAVPRIYANYREMFTGYQMGENIATHQGGQGGLVNGIIDNGLFNIDSYKDSFYQYIGIPLDTAAQAIVGLTNWLDMNDVDILARHISQLTYRWCGTDVHSMYLRVPVVTINGSKLDYTISGIYVDDRTDFTGIIKNWDLHIDPVPNCWTLIDTVWYQDAYHDVYRIDVPTTLVRNIVFSVNYLVPNGTANITANTAGDLIAHTGPLVDDRGVVVVNANNVGSTTYELTAGFPVATERIFILEGVDAVDFYADITPNILTIRFISPAGVVTTLTDTGTFIGASGSTPGHLFFNITIPSGNLGDQVTITLE